MRLLAQQMSPQQGHWCAPAVRRQAPFSSSKPRVNHSPQFVLPPFSGGLHCGDAFAAQYIRYATHAPAVRRRAPLRPGRAVPRHPGPDRAPPLDGGLYCGSPGLLTGAVFSASIELAQHCAYIGRSRNDLSAQVRQPESSEPCSRRSAAGSIAACPRRRPGHPAPSAPAVQRRAPLRHLGDVRDPRAVRGLPLFSGGLHCGQQAMLNPMLGRLVLPPFSSGLHCGEGQQAYRALYPDECPAASGGLHCGASFWTSAHPGTSCAPAVHRRALFRVCRSPSSWTCPGLRAPAYRRRAPLRRRAGLRAGDGIHVLPPSSGGLHCGPPNSHTCCRNLLGYSRCLMAGSIAAG